MKVWKEAKVAWTVIRKYLIPLINSREMHTCHSRSKSDDSEKKWLNILPHLDSQVGSPLFLVLSYPSLQCGCCSVAKLCPILCKPMDSSMPGSPVLHCLSECSNSCPLSLWCYLTISSSAVPFSFCLQSFPASRSFLISQLFTSSGQMIGASASASDLPMAIQCWSPLGLAGLIFLQSKRLSRVFSSTTVRKHQGCDPWRGPWSIASISLDHRFCRDRDISSKESQIKWIVLGFGGRVHRKTTFTIM